jgi:hypothetical protein
MDELCNELIDDYSSVIPKRVLTRNPHYDARTRTSTAGSSGEWIVNAETTVIDNICNGHGIKNVCRDTAPAVPPPGNTPYYRSSISRCAYLMYSAHTIGGYLAPNPNAPLPVQLKPVEAKPSADEVHDDL